MKAKNIVKFLFSLTAMMSFVVTLSAQSAQEIEMAKQYAKSMGYSDAQIDAAQKSYLDGDDGSASSSDSSGHKSKRKAGINRNLIEEDQDIYVKALEDADLIQNQIDSVKVSKDLLPTQKVSDDGIFGHNIFGVKGLSFVPNYNIPTPASYKLAAGDEVIINIWGDVITNITEKITPEGYINIPDMGLIYLAGQSVTQAEESVRKGLGKIYARLDKDPENNHIKLSIGKTRSVTVNVVGDVSNPGSYTVPSLSTVAMVMYMSGGPAGIGSVRNIHLYRDNKLLSTFDAYDFLMNGIVDQNLRLEDNDIISVAPYDGVVDIIGGVKRPMKYEIVDGEKLQSVLDYAGGFSDEAFTGSVVVERINTEGEVKGATAQSFLINNDEFDNFTLRGGDVVIVSKNLNRFANRATINGAVWREGSFAVGEGENQATDLFELIQMAGGLRDDAYLKRGYIERYTSDRVREQISFSPANVLLRSEVVELKADDVVRVLSIDEVTTRPTVNIAGEVNQPDQFEHRQGMTLGDLILMAGGVSDGATLTNVEIARRILDTENQDALSKSSTVMMVDLLKDPSQSEIVLEPYDMVFVRKSVNYRPQMSIEVSGEVLYPGTYVIESNTVRLSDLIAKAGGVTTDAYVNGASLKRVVTEEEIVAFKISQNISLDNVSEETEQVNKAIIDKIGRVAIDLTQAIENPSSTADIVLKEGDVITVPQMDNTVSIMGHIMSPNSVVYDEDFSVKEYVAMAGGYQKRPMRRRIYAVQMNGMTAKRGTKNFDITPGTTIVVPEKAPKKPISQAAAVASTFSTIALAIVALFVK